MAKETVFLGGEVSTLPFSKTNATNFADEKKIDRLFTFTITNGEAGDRTVVINPSLKTPATALLLKEGVIAQPGGSVLLTAAGDNATQIAQVLNWVKNYPVNVLQIDITGNSLDQTNKKIFLTEEYHPIVAASPKTISLQKYKDKTAIDNKTLNIDDVEMQLDCMTELAIVIAAGATTTISIHFGIEYNTAASLRAMTRLGRANAGFRS